VILASDRLVRELNRDWRGKDTTTDVLSFPAGDPPPLPSGAEESAVRHLGEIVVSVPRCRAQAQEQGVDPGVELVRLVIHGLLHLLGHDHEKPAERARMQARERVLRRWASSRGLGPGMLRDPRVPVRAGRRPLRREAARRTR
jgi:probable rRNA maturation factor